MELFMNRNGSTQNAGHMKQTSPLIHWPAGLEPHNVDVFVHNEGWIDAPPDLVWANLIDAAQWPSWYSNSADLRIEGGVHGSPRLGPRPRARRDTRHYRGNTKGRRRDQVQHRAAERDVRRP